MGKNPNTQNYSKSIKISESELKSVKSLYLKFKQRMVWHAAKYFYITVHKTSKNKVYKSRHKSENPPKRKGLVKN